VIAALISILAISLDENVPARLPTWAWSFAVTGIIFGVILVGWIALRTIILNRRARSVERIHQDIARLTQEPGLDPESLRREAHSSSSAQGTAADVVDQLVDRSLVDASIFREEAEEQLLKYVPPSPRAAKRMVNHLRLLLYVAIRKKIFGGVPDLKPRHLGKWVALRELWPELGLSINNNPDVVRLLEESVDTPDLGAVLHEHAPNVKPSDEMFAFFRKQPALADVAERLVYFRSAA
jgi:hypothetical protein